MEEQRQIKAMIFQLLKWVAIAMGIMLIIGMYVFDKNQTGSLINANFAGVMVLFAIFFHLEQHTS